MEDDTTMERLVEELKESVKDEFDHLLRWMLEERGSDLKALEDGLRERGNELLLKVLKGVLSSRDVRGWKGSERCVECGERTTYLGQRPKRVHLALGEVEVQRRCYWCKSCSKSWAPLDRQLGIDQSGRSPRLVEALAILGSELPFKPAAERLAQLCGVEVCPSQIEEVSEGIGASLEAQQMAEVELAFDKGELPEVENTSPWVIVAMDGVMVPHRDGHHEVKVATIEGVDPALRRGHRLRPTGVRYVVHTGGAEMFGRLTWMESYRQGVEDAQQVIVLGDGASWIWALAEEHWPKAIQILDFWHATEHLWSMGRALFGEEDERVAPWVQAAKEGLAQGKVRQMMEEWSRLNPNYPEPFRQGLTYFRNQSSRMNYHRYRERGYPIGSGSVESANRHVVGVRVKQAGMRWLQNGVRGILTLRALLRSRRWAHWWENQSLPIPITS